MRAKDRRTVYFPPKVTPPSLLTVLWNSGMYHITWIVHQEMCAQELVSTSECLTGCKKSEAPERITEIIAAASKKEIQRRALF